jgi:hypothetical protein
VLDGEPATCWEVVDRRYPDSDREVSASTRMLALRETLAHLDRLARAGRAAREAGEDGADRFGDAPPPDPLPPAPA